MMEQIHKQSKQTKQSDPIYKQKELTSVYSPCQITKTVVLPITSIGKNLQQILEQNIIAMVGGKCIVEGYVNPKSIKVITFSSGLVKGDKVIFDIVFNCEVCHPVSGMKLNCIAKTVTLAGISGESADEQPSPVVVSIARDHYFASDYFNSIKTNDRFVAQVIAIRLELNDSYVSVIAKLVPPQKELKKGNKQRLIIDA